MAAAMEQPTAWSSDSPRRSLDRPDAMMALRSGSLSDTQSEADRRNIPLDRVGIRGLRYPAVVAGPSGGCPTVATWSLTVGLRPEQRGVHMSRLVASLNAWDRRISKVGLERFLIVLAFARAR